MQNTSKDNLRHRAYQFSLDIIGLCQKLPFNAINKILVDQLLRSSTLIGANLVEARSSSSKRDFIKFFDISLKSANETQYWLCLLRDSKIKGVDSKQIAKLLDEADQLCRMLAKSLLTLKQKV